MADIKEPLKYIDGKTGKPTKYESYLTGNSGYGANPNSIVYGTLPNKLNPDWIKWNEEYSPEALLRKEEAKQKELEKKQAITNSNNAKTAAANKSDLYGAMKSSISTLKGYHSNSTQTAKQSYEDQLRFIEEQEAYNKATARDSQEKYNPFIDAGTRATQEIEALLGDSNSWLNAKFNTDELENDAGYQWRLKEGQNSLNNSIAAKQGLLSGAALKASIQYNQGFASNEYQAAYDRFEKDKATRYGYYNDLANRGLDAADGYNNAKYISNAAQLQQNASQNYSNSISGLNTGLSENISNILMGGTSAMNEYRTVQGASLGANGQKIKLVSDKDYYNRLLGL